MKQPVDSESGPTRRRSVSTTRFWTVLLRRWRTIVGTPLVLAGLTLLICLSLPSSYTVSSAFVTSQRRQPRFLQQSGWSSSSYAAPEPDHSSPAFLANLLESKRMMDSLADSRVRVPVKSASSREVPPDLVLRWSTIAERYDVDGRTVQIRRERVARRLREEQSVAVVGEVGLVRLRYTTPWPDVSHTLARRSLEILQAFVTTMHSSRERAEAKFLARRMRTARMSLETASDSLQEFLERNRGGTTSPALHFRRGRLERRYQLEKSIVRSLASALERARAGAARSTPAIAIVESPMFPTEPDSAQLLLRTSVMVVVGSLLAFFWVVAVDAAQMAEQRRREDVLRLTRVWRRIRDEGRMRLRSIVSGSSGGSSR